MRKKETELLWNGSPFISMKPCGFVPNWISLDSPEPEEKEFFGSCAFEVSYGDLDLSVSFSSYHNNMILLLMTKKKREEILHIKIYKIMELRIRDNPKRLLVMTTAKSADGSDPALIEKVAITVDPFKVAIND